jgi:hypothetical protein
MVQLLYHNRPQSNRAGYARVCHQRLVRPCPPRDDNPTPACSRACCETGERGQLTPRKGRKGLPTQRQPLGGGHPTAPQRRLRFRRPATGRHRGRLIGGGTQSKKPGSQTQEAREPNSLPPVLNRRQREAFSCLVVPPGHIDCFGSRKGVAEKKVICYDYRGHQEARAHVPWTRILRRALPTSFVIARAASARRGHRWRM